MRFKLSLKLEDIVGNIFYTDQKEKEAEEQKTANLQQTANNVFGKTQNSKTKTLNPFLNKNGELINPRLNYQKLLDNPNISQVAKNYITQATGLTPTTTPTTKQNTIVSSTPTNGTVHKTTVPSSVPTQNTTPTTTGTGEFTNSVGKRVANTSSYNNSAAKGQCVWYVRGRASEKLGKTVGALGNANEMWYNAKSDSKLSATEENIKPNTVVSYKYGTGSAGQKYGHVIFIEDVVGDTVYYTEGGSGYYKNGTDGVVKTATKQGILSGVNTNGSRMGSEVIGFIDLSKY